MTQIDFAIGFLLTLSIITYSIISVTNTISNDFNLFTSKRLENSASSLYKQLFEIRDNKSLISDFKKIQIVFEEIGGYPHSNEQLNISITPIVNKIHVYDRSMNEITSNTFTSSDNITVYFHLDFLPNEKKYVNIFYYGNPTTTIDYINNYLDNNITGRIISEEDVAVLSKEKCSKLKALSYEDVRNVFGFTDNFRIQSDECEYGQEQPITNIIKKAVWLFIENKTDERIYSGYVKLLVW